MASAKTQPARGMRDFLPEDVRRREYVIGVIREVYERYGFEPLETPAVENIETLMGKYGEEGNQLIYRIMKRGLPEEIGDLNASDLTDLALRYDLTVPLARVVAQYRDKLPKFFKRYQIQPVWRADRPARGRFREFYQCDVDVLGSRSVLVEAELIAAVSDVLTRLGFDNYTIKLNHREVLAALLRSWRIPSIQHSLTLTALDKIDKVGPAGVREELIAKGVVPDSAEELLKNFVTLEENRAAAARDSFWSQEQHATFMNESYLSQMRSGFGGDAEGIRAIDQLSDIIRFTMAAGIEARRLKVTPQLARGLSYYTGAIFEVSVEDLPGSLGGGGRYDNLVGMFLGDDVPACGFSLGLERIIVVMTEREMFPPDVVSSPADVMVTIWNEDSIDESIALAHELRGTGLRVDLYPEADKVGKQFKYASSRGIPFVAVIGDEERVRGEVAIKDMRSGEQRSVKRDEAAEELRKSLAKRS